VINPEQYFFNDVDTETAQKWSATLTAAPVMTSPLTHNPYTALPCGYVVLEKDCTLPMAYQEGMARSQTDSFTIYYAPSGHSPHISWTDGLVETVEKFAHQILA
jgi:hypothetical protein